MSEPQKIKAKLLDAQYVKEAQSVLMLVECDKGKFRTQINRSAIASFGNRTEEEIEKEMIKYVEILKGKKLGKSIFVVFDTDLDKKLQDHYPLKY